MDTNTSVDLDALSAFCAKSLTDVAGKDTMAIISMPVPIAPLETFLSAAPRTMSLMWHSPAGHAIAASGAAARIDVHGETRLKQLRERSDALFASMTSYTFPGWEGPRARIFGGLAFAVGGRPEAGGPWEEFGDGCFTLPRWTYAKTEEGASLTLATRGSDDDGLLWREGVMNELEGIFEALQYSRGRASIAPPGVSIPREHVRQSSYDEWQKHIGLIHAAIEGGGFEKIVAARRCEVDLVRPLGDLDVLARLIWETRCVRFYFRRERTAFLGASPETLFVKSGLQLTSEALAGTIRSFGSDIPRLEGQSSRLMNSDKDLSEHGYVVREIRNSLRPLSAEVTMHEKPEIRKIRNILHLNTRLSAALLETTHATDLLAALHPTPAVGGAPTIAAAEWIVKHEPQSRGWYTGAVGWIDSAGDAEFAVAIRSGVLTEKRAYLFTGAGIVRESDAEAEYAETALKQEPILRALGVEPA